MPMTVHYPSGKTFRADGQLITGELPGTKQFAVAIDTGSQVLVLDPRAFVAGDDGSVPYHPRVWESRLAPWVKVWLRQNPEWYPVASIAGQQAAGAMPNGTRVMKVAAEKEDANPLGTLGVVLGSLMAKDKLMYQVKWDGTDTPTMVLAEKIGPA